MIDAASVRWLPAYPAGALERRLVARLRTNRRWVIERLSALVHLETPLVAHAAGRSPDDWVGTPRERAVTAAVEFSEEFTAGLEPLGGEVTVFPGDSGPAVVIDFEGAGATPEAGRILLFG